MPQGFRLAEIIIYVEDMESQVRFYRDRLGLTLRSPLDSLDLGHEYWVEFDTGQCTLALHGGGKRRQGSDAAKFVFAVPEVAGARDALLRRGVAMGEIRSPGEGIVVCDAIDPEGNRFSFESREDLLE